MPKCKNYDAYYTGKEPSPRGIGYHAQGEEVGTERIGKNQKVWHVVKFGVKQIHRWMCGQRLESKFLKVNQIIEIEAYNHDIGLLYPNTDPYIETSWCPYFYRIIDSNHIQIIKNELGIELRPMLIRDFVELYKKIHGINKFQKK